MIHDWLMSRNMAVRCPTNNPISARHTGVRTWPLWSASRRGSRISQIVRFGVYHTSEPDSKNQVGPSNFASNYRMSPPKPSAIRVPLSAGAAERCFEIAKIGGFPLAPRSDQVSWIGGGIQRCGTLG